MTAFVLSRWGEHRGKDLCGWRAREVEQPCDQMLDSCWLCLQMSNADRRFYDL